MSFRRATALLLLLGACGGPRVQRPTQPASPQSVPTPPVQLPYDHVWTAEPETTIRTMAGPVIVPRIFTRLEALGLDSLGLVVRCASCTGAGVGYVDTARVVHTPRSPAEAAEGTLAEFLLAVRRAAAERDLDALYPVMAIDFTYSLLMASGRLEAFRHWRYRRFEAIDRLPELLDGGLVTGDGRLWVAPPEYLADPGYEGLRTGFRRENGRWSWLFLVNEQER